VGTVMRKVICSLLHNKAFAPSPPYHQQQERKQNIETKQQGQQVEKYQQTQQNQDSKDLLTAANVTYNSIKRFSPLLEWETLESVYPRYPDIKNLEITDVERFFRYNNFCSIIIHNL
jgi:hypothetical protein